MLSIDEVIEKHKNMKKQVNCTIIKWVCFIVPKNTNSLQSGWKD